MGQGHCVALNTILKLYSQVVAVAARKFADAQEFAKKHSISRAYGSYEELARDPEIGWFLSDLGQISLANGSLHLFLML